MTVRTYDPPQTKKKKVEFSPGISGSSFLFVRPIFTSFSYGAHSYENGFFFHSRENSVSASCITAVSQV